MNELRMRKDSTGKWKATSILNKAKSIIVTKIPDNITTNDIESLVNDYPHVQTTTKYNEMVDYAMNLNEPMRVVWRLSQITSGILKCNKVTKTDILLLKSFLNDLVVDEELQ